MSKETTNSECIFCKIANGEIPAVKIWEDKKYVAFLDMNPVTTGHTLLIPKKHDDYIFDMKKREYTKLMLKAKEVAKILKEKLNPKRVGVIIEGFGVPHVHIHLIPINKADEISSRKSKTNLEELNKIAKRIKE
ncbi:HIT family protein [Candidatus Pacearchaeota archaeon]|nr:HIT family protein [Candidatus Pacearchaeota archaeon]